MEVNLSERRCECLLSLRLMILYFSTLRNVIEVSTIKVSYNYTYTYLYITNVFLISCKFELATKVMISTGLEFQRVSEQSAEQMNRICQAKLDKCILRTVQII